ncbi:MAG: alpha-amylase family glycosyl hydrolase, partial [Bacteroidales bacterium]
AVLFLSAGCKKSQPVSVVIPATNPIHERLATGVIYEVNIRQITTEGTLSAFTEQHMERLKNLGVDILWLMPTYPISVKNRKGTLGSYYSIADYKGVNPEFGTMDDMKELVNKAHEAGMLVIFDWVANHTGWDNPWIKQNPEWYTRDKKGKIVPPVADWSDVADLNFEQTGMQQAMIDAMEFWVRDIGIDGYRCDAAAMVPTPFWKEALANLDSIKPVIKLAEAWEPELLENGFDAAYGWEFHHLLNEIAQGKKKVTAIKDYIEKTDTLYAEDDILMNFITNHDENSWAGTEYERMGKYVPGFAAITYLMPGVPMIYTGQEAGLNKRLRFFEKDTISWADTSLYSTYRKLNSLKEKNPALRAGIAAGNFYFQADSVNHSVVLLRTSGENKVLGLFNFSDKPVSMKVPFVEASDKYWDVFSGDAYRLRKKSEIQLDPWEYLVLEQQ